MTVFVIYLGRYYEQIFKSNKWLFYFHSFAFYL